MRIKIQQIELVGEYYSVTINDSLFIFSTNREFEEPNNPFEGQKFYLKGSNINTEEEGDFIGYLVSGDAFLLKKLQLNGQNEGSLDNIQSDMKRALDILCKQLEKEIPDSLPVELYVVGHTALQYWEGDSKVGTTKDIDVKMVQPPELMEDYRFINCIYAMDRLVKNSQSNGEKEDLLINFEAKKQYFPFEISYTRVPVDEEILILYIGDKESIILNKVYAYFECLFMAQDNMFRTRDDTLVHSWLHKNGIHDKDTLLSRYPEFGYIQEHNLKWESFFNEY